MLDNINDILPKTLNKYNLGTVLVAAQICNEYQRIITDVFSIGETENITKANYFKNHILFVDAVSYASMQEIQNEKDEILGRLKSKFPTAKIRDIRIKLRD